MHTNTHIDNILHLKSCLPKIWKLTKWWNQNIGWLGFIFVVIPFEIPTACKLTLHTHVPTRIEFLDQGWHGTSNRVSSHQQVRPHGADIAGGARLAEGLDHVPSHPLQGQGLHGGGRGLAVVRPHRGTGGALRRSVWVAVHRRVWWGRVDLSRWKFASVGISVWF